MTDQSNRLAINPKSPHCDEALLQRSIGIRFNDAEKTNFEEDCVSEGRVRVPVGEDHGPRRHTDDDKAAGDGRAYLQDKVAVGNKS